MLTIQIKYFSKDIDKVAKIDKGDWIDLRAAKDMKLKAGDFALVPLGVGMILPDDYEAHILPALSDILLALERLFAELDPAIVSILKQQ